jgi:hypothetical protein
MAFAQPYQKTGLARPVTPALFYAGTAFAPPKTARGVITQQIAENNRALINLKKQA